MVPPDFLSQGRQPVPASAGDATLFARRATLRKQLRSARATLSPEERWQKSVQASHHLTAHAVFLRAHRLGLYMAVGAECPTLPLMLAAEAAGKRLFYPVLQPDWKGRLAFAAGDTLRPWGRNRFGIPEPRMANAADRVATRSLDLVILPLAGFDMRGNRLGMGAGYYDRCLEFRRHRRFWRRPLLIGLAFDCQQAGNIPAQPWDVPLDAVVTESGLRLF